MTTAPAADSPPRQVCFVLHSHLPWLLGHGNWPVGEEWLYQAYAHSYIPLLTELRRLADAGFTSMLTLGITPILAAQLDSPYALSNLHMWLHDWQIRTGQIPRQHPARSYQMESATRTLHQFEADFSRGISPMVRTLVDRQAMEVLGGPLGHPFTPYLDPRVHRFMLEQGLMDARRRWGYQPRGIWVPECAYRPGQEEVYEQAGVQFFLVDEPAVNEAGGRANVPYKLGNSPVSVIARDLHVSDHLWSAERGYPGRSAYLDFHDVNHAAGLRLSRVGDRTSPEKEPYDPADASRSVLSDAQEFVQELTHAFENQVVDDSQHDPVIVVAIDTELLGHWWREGIQWFSTVIQLLPASGIKTITLEEACRAPHQRIDLSDSSWGEGKDWRIWTSDTVRDVVVMNQQTQDRMLATCHSGRLAPAEQSDLLNEAVMQLSSDWAFMISRNSAADYARSRVQTHYQRVNGANQDPVVDYPFWLSCRGLI